MEAPGPLLECGVPWKTQAPKSSLKKFQVRLLPDASWKLAPLAPFRPLPPHLLFSLKSKKYQSQREPYLVEKNDRPVRV